VVFISGLVFSPYRFDRVILKLDFTKIIKKLLFINIFLNIHKNKLKLMINIKKITFPLFFILITFYSCENLDQKWTKLKLGYGSTPVGFETVDKIVNEFGDPSITRNLYNEFLNQEVEHYDWFNPENGTIDQFKKIHKEFNDIAPKKRYWSRSALDGLSRNERAKIIRPISNYIWGLNKKMLSKINSKIKPYKETNKNRLEREKELGFKFDSFYMDVDSSVYVYIKFESPSFKKYQKKETQLDNPPNVYYKYVFDLGEYDYYDVYEDNRMPKGTKVQRLGIVYTDSLKKVVSTGSIGKYGLTLCDCLTKPEYSNVRNCKDKLSSRYGKKNPTSEDMREDYYNCK
jgi:hypothetical protein